MRIAITSALIMVTLTACTPIADVMEASDSGPEESRPQSIRVGTAVCATSKDCKPRGPCYSVSCTDGVCVEEAREAGSEIPEHQQSKGDCETLICGDDGRVEGMPDDSDVPSNEETSCRTASCDDGMPALKNAPDSTACNGAGTCSGGVCSECVDGQDCSQPGDCTVKKYRCTDDGAVCEDTGEARLHTACGPAKVCQEGRCVPCAVGDECAVDAPCHVGRIASCDPEIVCESSPLSGVSCGPEKGDDLFCSDGKCVSACREGPCSATSEPCQDSHWDCESAGEPQCVMVPHVDGEACGESSSCHAGKCIHSVLVNGDFTHGLDGWTLSGDAEKFLAGQIGAPTGRTGVSTSPDLAGNASAVKGAISQMFTVPSDALALRFVVNAGEAHVRLKDAEGNILEDCTGRDSLDLWIPVSWDLAQRRGQTLTIAVEDDVDSGRWGYVTTTGFDVIREVSTPVRNPGFVEGLDSWEATGDAQRFVVHPAYHYYEGLDANTGGVAMYGRRIIVSTYTRDAGGETVADASRGALSQAFVIPDDAVALRFNMVGGRGCEVRLTHDDEVLLTAVGPDVHTRQVPVSWPLTSFRGMPVRLTVEDDSVATTIGSISVSGFDLVTSFNGP